MATVREAMDPAWPAAGIAGGSMYVSLKDVAARAGVSFQTASKVLNGNRKVVSEQTRARILAAAAELGYLRNALASGLVTRSTYTIGIITDDLSDWVLGQFVVGAEQEARHQGHAVLISTTHRDADDVGQSVRQLLERRVHGILTAAPSLEEMSGVAVLLRGRVPAVSIHHVPGGAVPVVGSDHGLTARLAAQHLLELGHRRLATVTGPPGRRVSRSRLRGLRTVLDAAGVELPAAAVVEADWSPAGGFAATHALFDRDSTITAIFAQNDDMAIGVLAALARLGRRVPDDCAVVGCDDLPQAAYLVPSLTSVHIPFLETGRRAMALLLDRISGVEHAERVLMPVRLVIRGSTVASATLMEGSHR
jgi:LacI family transcriptional regulator